MSDWEKAWPGGHTDDELNPWGNPMLWGLLLAVPVAIVMLSMGVQ